MKYLILILTIISFNLSGQGIEPSSFQPSPYLNGVLRAVTPIVDEFTGATNYLYVHTDSLQITGGSIDSTIVLNEYGTVITETPANTWNVKVDTSKIATIYDLTLITGGGGTVSSVDGTGGTGISVTGGPITTTGTLTITNTLPDQVVSLTGLGIANITGVYPNFTINATEIDGSTTNEIQYLSLLDSVNRVFRLQLSSGNTVKFKDQGITSEVDGDVSNELQTIAVTGTTTGVTTLSNSGGSMTIAGGGINTVGVSGSTITVTGTEVDGSISNEIQSLSLLDSINRVFRLQISGGNTVKFKDTNSGGTVGSIDGIGGTGISVTGGPITGSGALTITNTAPDQVVAITGAGITNVTGTYPNFTVTSTEVDGSVSNEIQSLSLLDSINRVFRLQISGGNIVKFKDTDTNSGGTVTSVDGTAGTGISVTGGPITSSGSLTITNTLPNLQANLSVSGTTSPLSLNSSDGTDVTVTSGTGISLTGSASNITITNSSPDQTVSITGGGITNVTGTYPNFTATSTEVDGSTTNEKITALTWNNAQDSLQVVENGLIYRTKIDGFLSTEVDGDISNELQTIAVTGTTTGITTLSNSGGSMTIAGAGINTVGVSGSTITVTGTEVGDISAVTVTAPITGGGTSGSVNIGIQNATNTTTGALTSTDWNTFNNKLDGIGLADKVSFWSSANNVTYDNEFHYASSLNRLSLGTNSAQASLHIASDNSVGNDAIIMQNKQTLAAGLKSRHLLSIGIGSGLSSTERYYALNNTATSGSATDFNIGYFNGTSETGRFSINSSGNVNITDLAGSGNRMVIANGSGTLSTQTIPTGTVTSITATAPLTGGTITSSGSIGVDTTSSTGLATQYDILGLGGLSGSGTTNYIPKWSGSTSLNNSLMYQSGQSLNIAYDDNSFSRGFTLQNTNTGTFAINGFSFKNSGGSTIANVEYYPSNYANSSIADFASVNTLGSSSGILFNTNAAGGDGANSGNIIFKTGGNANPAIFIKGSDGSGYVGLGNTSPQKSLDVTGTFRVSSLDTDLTAPTTSGTTKTLISDANGDVSFIPTTSGTVTSIAVTNGTGISVTGSPITSSGTITVTNTAPDQTVTITEGGIVDVTGTYPNFTVSATEVDGSTTNEIQSLSLLDSINRVFRLEISGGNIIKFKDIDTNSGGTVTNIATSGPITGGPITTTGTIGLDTTSATGAATQYDITLKQANLVSGTNIKTVNSNSLLGSGNVSVGTVTSITAVAPLTGGEITGSGSIGVDTTSTTGLATQYDLTTISSGSTNLSITGTSSPLTLNSSTGTDVTFTQGTGITLSGSSGNVTITNSDADQSLTNEGSLSVGTGTASTSLINSNTSGSASITLSEGSGIDISESGNTITIANTGMTSLNGSTNTSQTFAIGTASTDFNIATSGFEHTFNLPTASASNRGALSTSDWTTFNGKMGGTGSANKVPYFTSSNALSFNSNFHWDNTNGRLGVGTSSPQSVLHVAGDATSGNGLLMQNKQAMATNLISQQILSIGSGSGFSSSERYYALKNTATSGSASDFSIRYWNGSSETSRFSINSTGNVTISDLSSGGSRNVICDANGTLSTATLSSGTVTSVQLNAGTGISLSGTNPITSSGIITVTNSDPDQSLTNEGFLGVGAGGSNDALLRGYNSSGTTTGNGTTISGGWDVIITESTNTNGGTITYNTAAPYSMLGGSGGTTSLSTSYTKLFQEGSASNNGDALYLTYDNTNDEIDITTTGTYKIEYTCNCKSNTASHLVTFDILNNSGLASLGLPTKHYFNNTNEYCHNNSTWILPITAGTSFSLYAKTDTGTPNINDCSVRVYAQRLK